MSCTACQVFSEKICITHMDSQKARIRKDFSEWFRAATEGIGSQTEIAKAVGVSQEQVSRWLNAHFAPTLPKMRDLAKKLKRPLPPGLLGHEEKSTLFETSTGRFISLARTARQIAAGEAIDDPFEPEEAPTYAFSLDWFRNRFGVEPSEKSQRFHVFKLASDESGDSMEPTIPRGALLLSDREGKQEDGAVYVVRHPELGGLVCKRLFKSKEGLVLESDNRRHRPVVVHMDADRAWDGARKFVIGRVVWVGFEL